MIRNFTVAVCLLLLPLVNLHSQFVHPGITHKKSDLDRIKYMVESQIDPWYSSYQDMVSDSKSSYDYEVRGDLSFTEIGRDNGVNYGSWNSDIRAAYYNAIRWYVTGDERHAQKAVEIFNSWTSVEAVTSNGTQALSGGVGYIMIEAAEIIKHTYDGWAAADIKKFGDMLVFPGYSNTAVPSGVSRTFGSFYWQAYQGDAGRHGNQGLSGWRTIMAIGIFLDNEIIYDRALRYIKGLPHRSDDLPYPAGAPTSNSITSSNDYADTYSTSRGSSIEDYGYNELMVNYIYENGQCQESSRDQQHVMFGLGLLTSMSEMAWNQGDDLYGFEDSRLLLGLEYSMRYNISYIASYPDQTTHWIPTVESGEFLTGFERTGRWFSKAISPIGIAGISSRPVYEMPSAHYLGRGLKTEEETKWITRTRDLSIDLYGFEGQGWTNDAIGWGGLTARRPEYCFGDPINGFNSDLPNYNMHVLPTTIEAENFDYFILNGNGKSYNDNDAGNNGDEYRLDEDVDVEVCDEGGFNVGWMQPGEWLTYTVYVPETGTYDLSVRYSANGEGGALGFSFGGVDKTGEVNAPSTGGWQDWTDLTVAEGVLLAKGVQSLRLEIKGTEAVVNINHFTISTSSACALGPADVNQFSSLLEPGIEYSYYEGEWNFLPDFESLEILDRGVSTMIELGNGEQDDFYGFVYDGYVEIETEGDYTFYTNSDDGTKLYIDGVQIVTNDGTHGAIEEQGSICLQAGFHEIKVEYFDKVGSNDVLQVSYEGPGISKKEIDELFHLPSDVVLATKEDVLFNIIDAFPNPFDDKVIVTNPLSKRIKIEVFNALGKHVYTTGEINGDTEIDLSKEETGLYILKISNDLEVFTKQVIKK